MSPGLIWTVMIAAVSLGSQLLVACNTGRASVKNTSCESELALLLLTLLSAQIRASTLAL